MAQMRKERTIRAAKKIIDCQLYLMSELPASTRTWPTWTWITPWPQGWNQVTVANDRAVQAELRNLALWSRRCGYCE